MVLAPIKGHLREWGETGSPLQSIQTLPRGLQKAEPIEVPFGMWTPVGTRIRVLDGGRDSPWERAILRGREALW